ncbi:Hypothetical protein A7982_01393 [Minicystis rosea]|nr:Hypothetical protein A7982_01393 [Minicystis rosea]
MKTALFLLLSGLTFAIGCGSSSPDDSSGGKPPQETPSSLVVSVDVSPKLPFYPLASDVAVAATVTDSAGKPLPDAKITWKLDPEDAAQAVDEASTFTLEKPGPLTFEACAVDKSNGKQVCGQAIIQVAPEPPVLVLTKPAPGAELGGDGTSTFTVEGKVTSSKAAHVFVDGVSVDVGSDGSFTTDVPAAFGVNHLIVSASDGENTEVRRELDVAFGAAYAPAVDATGAPSLSVPDALVLRLGQRFFDDGTPVALDAPHPVVMRDMADIVTRVVAGMDLLQQIPNPILNSSAATLQATSVELDDVTVEMSLVDDGLDLFVRVGALSLGTAGSLEVLDTTLSLDGGVDASVSAYAHASITKASPTDPVVVTVSNFDVALETATGAFNDPQANAVFALGSGFLRATVEGLLHDALAGTLESTVPDALESVFQSLDTALANKTVSLDAPPLAKVAITLDGHLTQVDTASLDSMRAGLSLDIKTDHAAPAHPESRGVALIDTSEADPLFDAPRSQLSIRLLVLNGLLHNLWNSGLLEVPVSSSVPLQVSGKLPPIVRLPRKGEGADLVVSLGELEVIPNGDANNGRLGVLVEAGLDIGLANDTLSLKLSPTPSVTVWIIDEPLGTTLYTPDFLRSLFLEVLWPKLQGGIESALAIELPIPPLDAIASVAPSLSGLELTTGMNGKVAYRSGFLVLDADIAATLP